MQFNLLKTPDLNMQPEKMEIDSIDSIQEKLERKKGTW